MYLAVCLVLMCLASSSRSQTDVASSEEAIFTEQQTILFSRVSTPSPLPSTRSDKTRSGSSSHKNSSGGRRNPYRFSLPLPPHQRKSNHKEIETFSHSSSARMPSAHLLTHPPDHSGHSLHKSDKLGHHNLETLNDIHSGFREGESDSQDHEVHKDSYGNHEHHHGDHHETSYGSHENHNGDHHETSYGSHENHHGDHHETLDHSNTFHYADADDGDANDDRRNHPTVEMSVDWNATHPATESHTVGHTRMNGVSQTNYKKAKGEERILENGASSSPSLHHLLVAMVIGTFCFRDWFF